MKKLILVGILSLSACSIRGSLTKEEYLAIQNKRDSALVDVINQAFSIRDKRIEELQKRTEEVG